MKYTVQSGKYVFKNFIYIFPLAILPAFFLSVSVDEGAIINVLNAFFSNELSAWTFSDLLCAISVLNFGSWRSAVFGVVGTIFIVPCVALLMAFLEKHFRIGKRTFNGLWSKLNDNFLSTCGYGILFLTIYELWSVLTAALLFFLSRISVAVVAYIIVVVAYLAMHVALLYVIGMIYLWLPCMQITGFRSIEALQYSYQLVTPVQWKILGGQMFVLLCAEGLLCLCAVFLPNALVFTILSTALYAIVLMVYCVRMEIAYFDRDHIERADLRTYY